MCIITGVIAAAATGAPRVFDLPQVGFQGVNSLVAFILCLFWCSHVFCSRVMLRARLLEKEATRGCTA